MLHNSREGIVVGTAFSSGSRNMGLFLYISEDQEAEKERNASIQLAFSFICLYLIQDHNHGR